MSWDEMWLIPQCRGRSDKQGQGLEIRIEGTFNLTRATTSSLVIGHGVAKPSISRPSPSRGRIKYQIRSTSCCWQMTKPSVVIDVKGKRFLAMA
jgi:hypothetical protein